MAHDYDAARAAFRGEQRYVELFLAGLPVPSRLLDLGCGTGRPIARYLVESGHHVTGVDSSSAMIELARAHVPDATLIEGEIESVSLSGNFDGIVAWDSLFHVDRARHATVYGRCCDWLRPSGRLLLSLGGSEWEGHSEMLGGSFFYSGYAPKTALAQLESAGLVVEKWEVDDPSSRGHIAVLAHKGS